MTAVDQADTQEQGRSGRYRLKVEPDGRSWTARENLTDILERELVGPSFGDDEVVDVSPDTLYLIGRIAPTKLRRTDGRAHDESADDDGTDAIDAAEGETTAGVPVGGTEDNGSDSQDDDVDDQPQKRGLMIPASMGLRFQLPDDCESFTVRASWGVYNPFKTEDHDAKGNPIRKYRRTPKESSHTIKVAELRPGQTTDVRIQDEVTLRIDRYDEPSKNRRLIELALCNDLVTPRKIPVHAWMFQTRLYIEADGEVFLPVSDPLDPPAADDIGDLDPELRRLELQYRDRLEYAIGRTCSVDWQARPGARRASKVWTTWLPVSETPQTVAREIEGALLDMIALSTATPEQLEAGLRPIVTGYAAWLDDQETRAATLPEHLQDDAAELIDNARAVQRQLAAGLDFLINDAEALRCFHFMNRVMADQRIHSQVAADRAADSKLGRDEARTALLEKRGASAHSWRTFQLAFVLMQLEAISKPELDRRSSDTLGKVELLFFPTGGGKTEAYLGLAAYTFAVRRRQGVIDTADGRLDGRFGVAVLMRYTLRLLTAQQFQRATTLICAAELARRDDPDTWGAEPFRIGLWVGTDVSPKRYDEAEKQLIEKDGRQKHRLTVLQIRRCPWCGTKIESSHVKARSGERRVHVYCGDDLGECPFSEGGEIDEGIPVLTVDEEIYRLTPAFVIATVDKFARLAREGEAAALFGYVRRRCERHGYVHQDYPHCLDGDSARHNAKDGLPAAFVRTCDRLRPPDLIIQDELHLITGALGTTVGLFEVAIDAMTRWRTSEGKTIKPMIIASTATVRNAGPQIKGLYGRGLTMFPPQVLDVADTFFSSEIPVDEAHPGRRYVGISTTGVRLTAAEIRVAEVLMAGAQLLLDRGGAEADPYLTLVGYFSSTRELAGMARYLSDDVQTALAKGRLGSDLPRRFGTVGTLNTAELTARASGSDITQTLDQLAVSFDPDRDSNQSRRRWSELRKAGNPMPRREAIPYDTVLATSMLQVGVDVTRLGLMMIIGQPKNTAEYIQASSRVGRDPSRSGLVVTLGNWARPRDLAHYEQFRHYHETFYSQVEPLSVTPFSITAIERGVDGLLISAVRVLQAHRKDGLSAEQSAGRIDAERDAVAALINTLVARASFAADGDDPVNLMRQQLENRLGRWSDWRRHVVDTGRSLVYEKATDQSKHEPLMISAEAARARTGSETEVPFVIANSMREVQPEINLLVTPDPDRLFQKPPPWVPGWQLPPQEDA